MEMVPLGETAQKTYEFPFCPLIDGGSTELPPSLLSLCLQLSDRGPVVYVEAEFFGGVGTQAYALFSPGESGAVLVSDTAINQALSWLGVSANGAFDEFEAVGLDQHRDTEEWVA
jgi:hypothetical protein